jgi:predicted NUDIX family phosphoesterase/thymidylate kinase
MNADIDERIAKLESRATEVRGLLPLAPRPFVIEFAGTPKSGKSTSVEAIRHFLGRHGFRVHLLAERAAVCPIPMKGHLFFNTWCATSMLAELLANIETETDIIIVDRGLFDALVWLTLQEKRGELTAAEADTIENFILLERWRTLTDLVVVMNVSPEGALARENSQRITRKGGSIMNPDVLRVLSSAVEEAFDRFGPKFEAAFQHENSNQSVQESAVHLADEILDVLANFLNPEVLIVPRTEIDRLPLSNGGAFGGSAFTDAMNCITTYGSFMRRAEAEVRPDVVQTVACGLLIHEDKVFVFQRKENDPKYLLYGKATIWQGAHISKQDGRQFSQLPEFALHDRLSRSLFLSRAFQMQPVGYCWDREDERSSRHFGLMYSVDIDNPHTAADLKKKEFRRRRGPGMVGEFVAADVLAQNKEEINLESWSRAVIAGGAIK